MSRTIESASSSFARDKPQFDTYGTRTGSWCASCGGLHASMRALIAAAIVALAVFASFVACGPSDDPCPDKPPTWFYEGNAGVHHHEGACTYDLPCGLKTNCWLQPEGNWVCDQPVALGACAYCKAYTSTWDCVRAFYALPPDAGTSSDATGG